MKIRANGLLNFQIKYFTIKNSKMKYNFIKQYNKLVMLRNVNKKNLHFIE